jgi:serine/threonine protein kinase
MDNPMHLAIFDIEKCIEALDRGECTEDEFLSASLGDGASEGPSDWTLLSYIDQHYRRGLLSHAIFLSLKSRIARRALADGGEAVTAEMRPAHAHPSVKRGEPHAPPAAPPCAPPVQAPSRREPPAILVGRILRNRYVIHSLLGSGGMGDVFKASDGLGVLRPDSKTEVAIKVIRARVAARPEYVARLQREFDSTRKLSHPNVVKVYEFDRDAGVAFYTMELLVGQHVGDLLRRAGGRALPTAYAWGIIRAVGAALAHAHSRNVIHGDVSPKNVMITRSGEVRVLDFGSSVASDSREGGVAATPAYASCELLEGQAVDPRDDLYALACLAYELLTGAHPFAGKRAADARALGLSARRPPGLGRRRWRTLQRGLAWRRAERTMPIREWLANLGLELEPQCLPPMRPAARSASQAPRVPRVPRVPRLSVASAAAVTLAAIACLSVAWHPTWRRPHASQISLARAAERITAVAAAADTPYPVIPVAAVEQSAGRETADPDQAPPPAPVSTVDDPPATSPATSPATPPPTAPATSPAAPRATPPPTSTATPRATPLIHLQAASAVPPREARSVIKFTANRYAIGPSAHFVEARVWRSRAASDTRNFVWWTEGSSAKAGQDFLAQARTPYMFSQGRQLASLFIRLIPNTERTRRADFRVCVGKPGTGSIVSEISCSAILLPARSERAS